MPPNKRGSGPGIAVETGRGAVAVGSGSRCWPAAFAFGPVGEQRIGYFCDFSAWLVSYFLDRPQGGRA